MSQAEQASPAVQQARLNLDVAKLETEKARAGHKPTLGNDHGGKQSSRPGVGGGSDERVVVVVPAHKVERVGDGARQGRQGAQLGAVPRFEEQ